MTRAETSEAKLSNFCAQGNQGTLKHQDNVTGYMGHRMPTQSNSIGCHCAPANGDIDCCAPQLPQKLPWKGSPGTMGKGPRPGAHHNPCIGETLLSAWWAGAHCLGVRQMVWSHCLFPALLSLPQPQPGCVCGICRSSGRRSSWQTSSCKVRLPSRHKANLKKPSSISGPSARCSCVPVAQTREWDSTIWGSEAWNISRFTWD